MIEYFLDPYPDEILYSVWARFSDYVQYPSKEDVLCELFGNKNAIPLVDLPYSLGYFFDHLPHGHAYTLDSLINQHTLFPFYAPFLPQDRRQRLREQMISDNGKAIHKLVGNLGNASSTESSPPWIRYCPICVEEDKARFGECYWHRLHQVRGVELCPSHNTYLENSIVRSKDHRRIETRQLASAEQTIHPSIPRMVTSSPVNNILMAIAKTVSVLLECLSLPPDDHFIHRQYLAFLAQRNFMTSHGLVRAGDLFNAFADYYPPELLSLLHCEIKQNHHIPRAWLATLIRLSGSVRHPLHHILVIHFLDTSVETFLSQEIPYPQPFGGGPWPCLNPVCEHYRQRHIHTCKISEVGGKGFLVGNFICSCGFAYSRSGPDHSSEDLFRRDKILAYGSLWGEKLHKLWLEPTIKLEDIANQLGVVRVTVNRQAAKLHLPVPRTSSWTSRSGVKHTRRVVKDCCWYRTEWMTLVNANPEESITALRKRLPGVYSWLKEHDNEWLIAHRPPSRQRQRPKNQIPLPFQSSQNYSLYEDMITRDAQIATAVKACAETIVTDSCYPRKVTKRRICVEVPELAKIIKHNIPPLTALALKDVLETQETFALRRIQWLVRKCKEERIGLKRKEFIRKINIDDALHIPSVLHAFDNAMTVLSQPI